jgi:signal transduction histidine kinase
VMLGLTPLVKGDGYAATIPGFWVMGALLAWGVRFRAPGGLVAGVLLAGTDLVLREEVVGANWANAFLLLIGGPIVGYVCGSLQQLTAERDEAQRAAATAAERARLARVVHDGVLQVLALVQRRGAEIGGEAAELGRLAGEQEEALRSLVRAQDGPDDVPAGTLDLAEALARLGSRPGVEVAVPAHEVPLPGGRGAEVVAVVAEALDNVARHAPGARAWVLLEAFGDTVEVVVRDDGPGIPEGRLEEAAAQGRLGVSQSIRGRAADLGGTAALITGPAGTTWTLTVPGGDA